VGETKEMTPLRDWAVIGINFGSAVIYGGLLALINTSDVAIAFMQLCHFALCLWFGISDRQLGWYISAAIVALFLSYDVYCIMNSIGK